MTVTLIKFPVFTPEYKFLDPYPKISHSEFQLIGYIKYHTEIANEMKSDAYYIETELNYEKK